MRKITLLLGLIALLAPELRAADATLRPGDTFDMKLTGMPPDVIQDIANLQYTVGPDGTVNVPLVGKLKASGLTSTQLEETIQAKFVAGKFFTNPTVIINVSQVARFVTVSGGVRNPGRQQWTPDLTLSSAIGNASDLSDFGDKKGVTIIREGKLVGTYNLKEIEKNPALDPKLLPGDQVKVKGG